MAERQTQTRRAIDSRYIDLLTAVPRRVFFWSEAVISLQLLTKVGRRLEREEEEEEKKNLPAK